MNHLSDIEEDEEEEESCDGCGSVNVCDTCSECGDLECECVCCQECGFASCQCCSGCELYPCECCDGCGYHESNCHCFKSKIQDCVLPDIPQEQGIWQHVWTDLNKWTHTNPVLQTKAADFYLLEAVVGDVITRGPVADAVTWEQFKAQFENLIPTSQLKAMYETHGNPTLTHLARFKELCKAAFDEMIEECYTPILQYVSMVCGGELRYHEMATEGVLHGHSRSEAWLYWAEICAELGDADALRLADEIFMDMEPGGSVGGPRWAEAARHAAAAYAGELAQNEHTNKILFLDRVWTMQHNGGSLLNKIMWSNHNDFSRLNEVLEAHGQIPEPNYSKLLKYASPKVGSLFSEYLEAINSYRRDKELNEITFTPTPEAVATAQAKHYISVTHPMNGWRAANG